MAVLPKIKALREKLQSVDFSEEVMIVAKEPEVKKELIKLNQDQLRDGKKTDGKRIDPDYSTRYAKRRKKMGLQIGFVDLKVTGTLYEKIDYFVKKNQILFFSRVRYAEYLEGRYAKRESHIFGLTDENLQVLKQKVIEKIRLKLGM